MQKNLGSFAAALAIALAVHAQQGHEPVSLHPPKAGEIAPAFDHVEWLQLDEASDPARGGTTPEIAKLRGQVVVIATFGHFCDSCVRVGIPAANAVRAANPGEVRVIGLTSTWQEETREETVEAARKLGIQHTVAMGDFTGGWTPYLNMNENPSLTWAYVITRSGGVLWAGDPSAKLADYYAAIVEARNQVPTEPLPERLAPELAPAVGAYIRGDFPGCEAALASITKKLGKKPDAERVRTDADKLAAALAATRKGLMDELERSVGDDSPEKFQRAYERVLRAYPKGECADRAGQLDMVMSLQRPHGVDCKHWSEWFAIEAARPATFPAEKDKASAKFAKELGKYVKTESAVGAERARAWLRDFELAPEKERKEGGK